MTDHQIEIDDLLEPEERENWATEVDDLHEALAAKDEQIASLRKQLDWYRKSDDAFNAMKEALKRLTRGIPREAMTEDWERALTALALAEGRS